MKRNDWRARNHAAYWAFLTHRLSGLALALFLPVHFWAMGRAIHGEAALDAFLRVTDRPIFKIAEWGLVMLLSLHTVGGVRLLLIEFRPWTGLRKDWIAFSAGAAVFTGLAFVLALFS